MRVLYLLFLLPLGVWASCPAGIQLSNVPIDTVLPYCVKWESSTLGGCAVDCKGVCVEIPAAGTKGPMQTTGAECELGGGDPGGGDTGGGNNSGDVGANGPLHLAKDLWLGGSSTADISSGFNAVSKNIERFKNSFETVSDVQRTEFSAVAKNIAKIAQNTTIRETDADIGVKLHHIDSQLNMLNNKSVLEPGFWNDKHNELTSILRSSGGATGGSGSADTAAIKSMMQTAMGWWGGTPGMLNSISYGLSSLSTDVGQLKSATEYYSAQQIGYQEQMAGDLFAIKRLLTDGQGTGGGDGGNSGDAGIDYSKMPGTEGNPIHVAGAKYSSRVCLDGMNCAFDLDKVNQEYSEAKQEMARRYDEIKKEVSETFKFELSGSASTPKCFDMFSLYGKSYSVCPDSGEYWNTLAAILMFIFYFIALMIVARR